MKLSEDVLRHALIGYEAQKAELESKIGNLQALILQKTRSVLVAGRTFTGKAAARWCRPVSKVGHRKPMSAAARKRIGAAQRKRWAEYRRVQKYGAKGRRLGHAA